MPRSTYVGHFGEQRLVRPDVGLFHRLLYRLMGVPDPAHFLHYRYFRRMLDGLQKFMPERILDAGCGAGDYSFYLARRYPGAEVLGVDIDRELVERNRKIAARLGIENVRFEIADLVTERFDGSFDLLVSIDVLEHVVPQDRAFANLAHALCSGGFAFFHIPTLRERPVPLSGWLKGFHEWTHDEHIADDLSAEQFVAAIRRAGFEIVSTTCTFGYFTGELATSLFVLPYKNILRNRIFQGLLAPVCRVLCLADIFQLERTRYAVAITARKDST